LLYFVQESCRCLCAFFVRRFVCISGFITYFIVQNQNYIENIPSYIQKLKYQESIFCWLALPYLSTKENSRIADELQRHL
jgi:hypothetical protein